MHAAVQAQLEEIMAKYQELADQARAGAFDAARRTIKVQEDVLGAVETY